MIRAGLILPLRGMWRGGMNYYHNLLSCYQQYPDALFVAGGIAFRFNGAFDDLDA